MRISASNVSEAVSKVPFLMRVVIALLAWTFSE
jgi:hypothetical protein